MAVFQSFARLIRSLTVDLIPSTFRQRIKFNQDSSGVYFDGYQTSAKNVENVYYSADTTTVSQDLRKIVFQHSYTGNVVIVLLTHVLSLITSISYSSMPFSIKLIIYIIAAALFKLFFNFLYHMAQKLNYGGLYSADFLQLSLEPGLAEKSKFEDRKNAMNYVSMVKKDSNDLSFHRRVERNSDYIKVRIITEQGF